MTDYVVSDQPLEDFGATTSPGSSDFASVKELQKGRARMWTDQERAAMQAEDTSPDEIQRLREAIAAAPHPEAKAALEEQLARATRTASASPAAAPMSATIQPASYTVADQPLDFAPTKPSSQFITPQPDAKQKGKEPGEFRKGFVGSLIDQQPNLAGGFLEAIGATTDSQGFKDAGAKLRQFGAQNADKRSAKVPSVANIRFDGSPGDIAQDISDYAAFQLGSGLGSSAPSLGAGLGATMLTANPVIGIAAGAFGPSYVQNAGDMWVSSMSDEGIKARLEKGELTEKQVGKLSLLAGVPMAALDVVGLEGALGNLMKPAKQALIGKIVHGMATGAISEGSTEGLQQVIEQWAQDYLGSNKTTHDKFIEIVDNVLGGALAGGATGGAAAPFHSGKAAPAKPAADQQQFDVGDVPLDEVRPEDQPFTRRGVMTTDDTGAAALTENPTPVANVGEPIEMVPGKDTTFSTERGAKLDGQFGVVDASSLTTSHNENLDQNAAYPQELQPRDRSRAASEIQVARIANNLQPDFLGESPMASQGAPIIGEDGVVESGNARSIALRRAYKNGKAEPYRQWILANAEKFGVDPKALEGIANPVLVRVRRTPVNRVEFSRQANESSIAQMSPVEQARADADRIGNLDDFKVDEDGDLNAPENRGFIRRFVGSLPTTEQGAMVDADGMLSQSGMARVRNAILARAYGETGPLMRIVESLDDNTRNISRALTRVAPMVAKVREAIRSGALHDRDITQDVIRAVEEFSKLRSKKMTVGQMLAQTSFFGNGLSPETLTLLQFLEDNSRSPARISAFIEAYLSALEGIGNPAQAGLFGANVVPSKEELLDAARQRTGTDPVGTGLPAGDSTPAKPAAERKSEPGGERAGGVSRPAESGEKSGERSGDAKRVEAEPAKPAEQTKPEKGEVTPDAIKKELRAAKEKKKKAAAPKPATPAPAKTEDSPAQDALKRGDPSGTQVAAGPAAEKAAQDPEAKAKADLEAALGEIGAIFRKGGGVKNITPEEEAQLLPALTKLFDAAFRLGYHKFKKAARFAVDQIRAHLGDEIADHINLDHLQGAYIGMSGRYRDKGADSKKDVVAIESMKEITEDAPASASPVQAPQKPERDAKVEAILQDGKDRHAENTAWMHEAAPAKPTRAANVEEARAAASAWLQKHGENAGTDGANTFTFGMPFSKKGEILVNGPPVEGVSHLFKVKGLKELPLRLPPKPEFEALQPDYPELLDAYERYDSEGELTARDLLDEVDALIAEGKAPDTLQSAVDKFREEIREDHEELAGRGDLDSATESFVDAINAVLTQVKPGRPSLNPPGFKMPSKEEKAALEREVEEHNAKLADKQVLLPLLTEEEAKKEFDQFHHLFDRPDDKEKVRTADAVKVYNAKHGWMSLAEARKKIDEWKAHAAAQGEGDNANGNKVVLSLFDLTGTWSQPWEDAGYDVYRFDIQEGAHYQEDINNFSVEYFNDMFGSFDGKDVHAILAACPCTDFAVSGARHFAAKDADGRTADSIKLVHQTLAVIEYFKPSIWAIENPVSRIEELGGLPPWRMSFDPNHFGEAYTKKTILWGRFNPTLPIAPVEPTEGSKMHSQYGGKSQRTKNARSATPVGFAYSFFMANNAIDNPTLAISGKYDRLDENLIDRAVKAGITAEQIDEAVEELYYQELDDKGANEAIRKLIPAPAQIKGELQAAKKKKKQAEPEGPVMSEEDVFAHRLRVAAEEIRRDISGGAVQGEVNSFSDLHDSVDANMYVSDGDREDDRVIGPLGKRLGWKSKDYAEFTSRLIDSLDTWIKGGMKGEPSVAGEVMPVMEAPPAKSNPDQLYITRDGQVFPVDSIEDAARKWEQYRDESMRNGGGGASQIGNGVVVHDAKGKNVASISYNGRIWNPDGTERKVITVDDGAHAAATSPQNDLPEPTLPQIKAGNYQKGHFKIDGLDISIENPAGSERSGVDANGKKWSVTMQDHYGYIRGTVGKDKDHIDVFVKVGTPEGEYGGEVYVIDQRKAGNGHFDEHKVMIGWGSFKEAEDAYLANYTKGWNGLEGIGLTTMEGFKRWLKEGDTRERFADWRDTLRDAALKRGYDFADTFPWPTNPEYYRDLLAETPFGEEEQSMRVLHEEQASELSNYLRDEAALRDAIAKGVDPATGKAPKTPSQRQKLDKRLAEEMRATIKNFSESLDAYAEAFGQPAADAFGKLLREQHASGEGSILKGDGTHASPQGAEPGFGQSDLFAEPGRAADSGPLGTGLAEGNEGAGSEGATSAGAEGTGDAGGNGSGGREAGRGELAPGGSRTDGSLWDQSQPARVAPANYTITDADRIGEGGAKTKYKDNIAAIRLAQRLTAAGVNATPEEQAVLARYVGWGGLKSVFDPESKDWSKEYAELKSVLPEDQYERARRSILDAHYTSVPIIRGIHAALSKMGFKGGRVLEPSVGVGNFFGLMPKAARAESSLFGIELDPITGQIASLLYPKAKIVAPKGFEDVSVPPGYFDVAIGNPPFGNQSVYDSEHPDISKFSIHNFFFAKSLESLRPGGIMGMVVSRYFLDQQDATARQWIAKRADLIGAVRLPYTAFKENANTEVVTDVLFFQKRETPLDDGAEMPDWVRTRDFDYETADGTVSIPRNLYYSANPRHILGRETTTGSMYRKNEYTVEPMDTAGTLEQFVESLPADIYKAPVKRVEELADVDGLVPEQAKVGAYFALPEGGIGRRLSDQLDKRRYEKVELASEMGRARIRGMIKVRDALRSLMRAELSDASGVQIGSLREKLNATYDEFVRKYGFINQLGNRRAFQEDPDLPLLESLEPNFDPGTSKAVAKKNNVPAKEPSAGKASIFTKRVLAPIARITKVDTPKDALLASLNEKGKVDLEYMAQIAGVDQDTLTKQLAGLIFEDPAGGWVTAEQYLSGNVKAALAAAKAAVAKDARFAANVDALERVQPADIEPLDISVRLGSPWLSEDTIADFTQELLGTRPKVGFIRAVGRWSFQLRAAGPANTATWGTQRVPADELIPAILNLKQIVVKDNVGTSKEPVYVVNEQETQAAQAKAEAIQQKFKDWIWADEKRRDTLSRVYNDVFNTDRRRTYDGSHLTLPGLSPALKLRPHQKDAIWRWLQDRTILLDHVVGAGKTFTIVGGVMEMRRMGIARKPTLVVPNYLVRQWRDEFYKAYPNANILACTEADFSKGNRERLFSRIATGDWDAVIVPHSSFKKVGMPPDTEAQITGEMASDLASAIETMKRERGDKHVMRDMERIKARLDEKMKRLAETGKKDKAVHFGELGIDALAVDEAHLFKNLFYFSQMQGVSGLGNPTGSGRAFDMFVKVRYLQQLAGERAIVGFATGTPVSNSLVEMFTMQRYLQYQQLRDRGIHLLDPWAGVFGDVQQVYEVHPSGNGYRLATRFAKFVNLPELMTMYRSFADVVTMKDLKAQAAARGTRWPIPKRATGKAILNVAERSPSQVMFFGVPEFQRNENGEIQFEAAPAQYAAVSRDEWLSRQQLGGDALKNAWTPEKPKFGILDVSQSRIGAPFKFMDTREEAQGEINRLVATPRTHYNEGSILWKFENLKMLMKDSDGKINALSITNEARKAGLDYRLIDPNAADFEGSKINMAVANMLRIYHEWAPDRGAQLVFCDLSIPASARAKVAKQAQEQQAKEADDELGKEGGSDAEQVEDSTATEDEASVSVDQLLALQAKHSVYDDVKAKLIAGGIPEEEIAFIHDFDTAEKKGKLFAMVRSGTKRFLIGSTEKMGAGMNVQERLVGMHHMDAPWRPSDLEQRNGRWERQGNALYERDPDGFEVEEHRYATKQTYDTRMWQIIEHKANGVEQLRNADQSTARTIEDISGEAATAADMKAAASGNPLILDEIKLRNQVTKLEAEETVFLRGRFAMERRLTYLRDAPKRARAEREAFKPWVDRAAENPPFEADKFSIEIGGKTYTDKSAIGGPLVAEVGGALKASVFDKKTVAGKYRGFLFSFVKMSEKTFTGSWSIDGQKWHSFTSYGMGDEFKPSGFIARMDNAIAGLRTDLAGIATTEKNDLEEAKKIDEQLKAPFDKKAELDQARRQHLAVVQKLQSQGGGLELTPTMRDELNAALEKRGVKKLSRSDYIHSGMQSVDVRDIVRRLLAGHRNAPQVSVWQNWKVAPKEVRDFIRLRQAEDNGAGAFINGEIHLFADNIADEAHAVFTLVHELEHFGLEGLFGSELNPILTRIFEDHVDIQLRVAKLRKIDPVLSKLDAIEEALADKAGEMVRDGKRPAWWQKLVAAFKDWLRKYGLWTGKLTDNDVNFLLERALKYAKNPPPTDFSHVYRRFSLSTTDEGRLSRTAEAPSAADTEQRVESILSRRGGFTPFETLARVPVQALRLDRLTSGLYDRLLSLIGGFVPEKVKAGFVSDYALPGAVIDRRDLMFAHMRTQLRGVENTLQRLSSLTRAESRVVYEWLNDRNADHLLKELPDDSRTVLMEVRSQIDKMGREAVRLGQLSESAYNANKLAYVHRSYRKYDLQEGEQARTARARAVRILGDQYKGRGITDAARMDKVGTPDFWEKQRKLGRADIGQVGRDFIRLERRENRGEGVAVLPGMEETNQLGRVLEVKYWPADEALPPYLQGWTNAGTWKARDVKGDRVVMWRDFTKAERERMGEIDEARYAIAKTFHQMIHDVEAGRYLEWLANTQSRVEPEGPVVEATESMAATFAPGTWVRVPESTIPGTNTKKYGKLAGLYLPGPVWNDVRQVVNWKFQPLGEFYADVLRLWKISKTALSPTVHANNIMANVVMADWHDITGVHLANALHVLLNSKDPASKVILDRFEDAGATQGMYALNELQRDQLAPLIDQLRKEVDAADSSTGIVKASAVLQLMLSGKLREAASAAAQTKVGTAGAKGVGAMIDFYQTEDTVFRLAAFMKAKSEGQSDIEAGKFARRSFLDYQINAPWIQALRQTAFPFISFIYRALPMLAETAARKPWKLMKLGLLVGAANALGYAMSGGDEDKERKLLPDEKAGRIWGIVPKLIRMPWNDAHDQPVFLDIRRWIPAGDVVDVGQGHSAVPVLPMAVPGGPLAVLAELLFNKSQFTGKEITKGTDTGFAEMLDGDFSMETYKKVADHLYKSFAPNFPGLPGSWSTSALLDAGGGRTDVFGREQSVAQAALSSVGVKVGSYPQDVLLRNAMLDYKAEDAEITRNMRALAREYARKGITREEFDRKMAAQLAKKKRLADDMREKVE